MHGQVRFAQNANLEEELSQIRESLVAAGVTEIGRPLLSENRRIPLAAISTNYVAQKAPVASVPKHKQEVHDHFQALSESTLFVSQIHELIADNKARPGGQVPSLRGLKQYVPEFPPDL
jgi:hypothetical protein